MTKREFIVYAQPSKLSRTSIRRRAAKTAGTLMGQALLRKLAKEGIK